jgi:hypothetical protein
VVSDIVAGFHERDFLQPYDLEHTSCAYRIEWSRDLRINLRRMIQVS